MHPHQLKPQELAEPYKEILTRLRLRPGVNMLRAPETAKKAGLGISTLWRDVKAGTFVPPVRLGPRTVAWIEAEVDAVLEAKTKMSRSHQDFDIRNFVNEIIRSQR